jgi:hypothetical protein
MFNLGFSLQPLVYISIGVGRYYTWMIVAQVLSVLHYTKSLIQYVKLKLICVS